jgi:ribose-phosphate pyrophosphokinase
VSNLYFSTTKYQYMLDSLKLKSDSLGQLKREVFPDGERYTRIVSKVFDKNVVIIGATVSDSDLMEIIELSSALVKYGAKSLSVVIPYFGYSTMERAVKDGEVVGAKIRARLLSSIPQSPMGNKFYLFDLHSEGIPYYFEGNVFVKHVYGKSLVMEMIQKQVPKNMEYVLGSTDAGRAKWVESLAKEMGIQPAFVYKQRLNGSQTQVSGINADVKNKHVVIYDDMIRSGSSIINAAKEYLNAGASSISICSTHGVFCSKDGLSKKEVVEKILTESKALAISVTDSHVNSQDSELKNIKLLSVYSCIKEFFQ